MSESSGGMKQSVKMKALMKLGVLANKIGRRINMGPNAPSANLHLRTLGRSQVFQDFTRMMSSRQIARSLFQSRAPFNFPIAAPPLWRMYILSRAAFQRITPAAKATMVESRTNHDILLHHIVLSRLPWPPDLG